ncbi:MAG: hypothetical protein PHR06_15975 [Candidatus Cloacimonetes bacterium]|nr:hypothetical protein [Candidatus Cloacimonadota bacterium]
MLSYDNGKIGTSYLKDGVNYEFSSIVIGEDKIYLVMKQYAMIAMYDDLGNSYTYTVLNAKSFSIMNKDLVGFYPRELYLHPRNNEYFYVKFPRHVCLMTVFGTIPKAIDCVQVLDRIIPEEQWTVIVGTQSYVVITPNQITEYSILGNSNSALHSISIPSVLFPVYYNQFLNTIIMRATGNMMIYYKLNKPVIDSIYFETQLKS